VFLDAAFAAVIRDLSGYAETSTA